MVRKIFSGQNTAVRTDRRTESSFNTINDYHCVRSSVQENVIITMATTNKQTETEGLKMKRQWKERVEKEDFGRWVYV